MLEIRFFEPRNLLVIAAIVLAVNFLFAKAKNALDGRASKPAA